ncbi:helix-turn-helix transcriptional regulator [Actinoplanes sp. RD1]|uniref:helix-turn-helix transcriptional regulator n=1 Tax=Actinoplanes sp. RD1 TaxID=3064538 RepID=UPI0027421BD6|nr:helix-turn-helix transcriptional regulator [Actinoplanes sp. RD1]
MTGFMPPAKRRIDRAELGAFLRRRRETTTPPGGRSATLTQRRTPGLRREEVAALAAMSANYYEQLEQGRGPQPSGAVIGSIARALRLSPDETTHLYALAGLAVPRPETAAPGVDPGLRTALASLSGTTAGMICTGRGDVLAENEVSVAVFGRFHGGPGNIVERWFTDRPWRNALVRPADQERTSAAYVADLRASLTAGPLDTAFVRRLRATSAEFDDLWARYDVATLRAGAKLLTHPRGLLELECAVLAGQQPGQRLAVFRAAPGTETESLLASL